MQGGRKCGGERVGGENQREWGEEVKREEKIKRK